MSRIPIRKEVQAFQAYTPGLSIDEIRQKYGIEKVIKLASNENPLGTSPVVRQTLINRAGLAFRYPQAGNPRLREVIAAKLGVSAARIVAGNGSDEIIDLLFRTCATPGKHNAVAFRPCFGIYTTQAALCGVALRQADLSPDFSFPWEKMAALVDADTALVFLTTPDNPSGYTAKRQEVAAFADKLPDTCLLVVDEAYTDFTDDPQEYSMLADLADSAPLSGRVAVLHTFSKIYGMAGLRLGYAVLPEDIAEYMWRIRLPFSVNLMAEEAALAALQDRDFYEKTRQLVLHGRTFLAQELTRLGCNVCPSQANFLMFSPPQYADAQKVFTELLKHGIILRPLNGYNLPDYLRVTVGTEEENCTLLAVLRTILATME